MAGRFQVEPAKLLSTLKNTVFKGASDDELLALVVVANEYGLNPLTKEIYAFPAKGGGIVPVVSVDGWIRIINDHAQMDGIEFEWENDQQTKEPISCTAIIYRKDRTHPTKVTEYLSECRRNTDPWKMVHRMLRHKALIQGGRVAFGFGGIYDEDEARDIASRNVGTIKTEAAKPAFAATIETVTDSIDMGPTDHEEISVPTSNTPPEETVRPADEISNRQTLAQALADAGIREAAFIGTLAKAAPKAIGKAKLVAELTEEIAAEALKDLDALIAATEEAAQK